MSIDEKFRAFAHYLETGIDPIRRAGVKVLSCRERQVKLLMPLEGNTNHLGIMYGGSLLTLAEMSGGALCGVTFDYRRYVPVIKDLSLRFCKPAISDVTLEVAFGDAQFEATSAALMEKGKCDFTLSLEIKDETGTLIASATGLYQVRNIPEGLVVPIP